MNVGMIGTGRMAQTLANLWTERGHSVWLGSRTPGAVNRDNLAGAIQVGSWLEAAAFAEIIAFAFPWYALTDVERGLPDLAGKIIIDMINPIMSSGSLALGHKTSAAETIARSFPAARVVKAFNHIPWQNLARPVFDGQAADLYLCGDDDKARLTVAGLGAELGFTPVDCGPLRQARLLEPLALLWIQLAYHYGHGPDFAFKIIRRADS